MTGRIACELPRGVAIGLEVFNPLDQEPSDVDYFYESRLPSEPLEPFSDIHFHPLRSRSVRFFVSFRP